MANIELYQLDSHKLSISDLAGLSQETIIASKAVEALLGTLGTIVLYRLIDADSIFRSKLITAKVNPFTEKIARFDGLRDDCLGEIHRTAKTASKSSIVANADAGESLMIFIYPYRHVAKEPLMSQTSTLNYMQTQFNADPALQAAAATLQLTDVFANMFSANEQVSILWNERAIGDAEKNGPSPSSLKNNLEKVYHDFCNVIVLTANYQPNPEIETLVSVMNDIRIKYSKFLPTRLTVSNTVTEPIAIQKYTGKNITPLTRVFHKKENGELNELQFTVDFYITYRNNIEVGEAQIIIHGKGKYKGSYISTFHIEN
jgi:hypothetical protein